MLLERPTAGNALWADEDRMIKPYWVAHALFGPVDRGLLIGPSSRDTCQIKATYLGPNGTTCLGLREGFDLQKMLSIVKFFRNNSDSRNPIFIINFYCFKWL
jgi:hypothetical protein